MSTVRTRFAPSPTGYLHIGGVRTAMFCWLFSRRNAGKFLLRIDDTDQARNVEEALAPILHGFRWLGMTWDEGPEVGGPHEPYYQSKRLAQYQAAAEELLKRGLAYRDYASPEDLDAERKAAEAEKRPFLYSRKWMAETPAQAAAYEAQGRKGVVRLKMPREGKLVVKDLVRGDVEFEWAREQDHVVQRADGTCLYHLASVVDDHDFGITHVIRAEEHLSNTPRQIFIAQSLGYPLPEYAHLPFVAEPGSKNKLSKRKIPQYLKNKDFAQVYDHGRRIAESIGITVEPETFNPVVVHFYEQVGYLPEAILNYLLLLGWSLDDKTEFIAREKMFEVFSIERVVKASASFDPKKLWAFQDHYMRELPLGKKIEGMLPFLYKSGVLPEPATPEQVAKLTTIVSAAGDRLKVFGDVIQYARPFFAADDQFDYDEDAFKKRVVDAAGAVDILGGFGEKLTALETFDPPALEAALQAFIAERGLKPADLVHVLRVAATGQGVGAGLYDCLSILGKDSVLRRIERTKQKAAK